MKNSALLCKDFVVRFPDAHRALAERFDVEIFDILQLGGLVERLRGRIVSVAIMKFECFEVFDAIASILEPTGTRVDHYLTIASDSVVIAQTELSKLGWCGSLDVSMRPDCLVDEVERICARCPRHSDVPLMRLRATDAKPDRQSTLDSTIIQFVTRGMSDREIAEILHYSSQTIRNRVSRILKANDLDNRTDLAVAQFRDALRMTVAQSLQSETVTLAT